MSAPPTKSFTFFSPDGMTSIIACPRCRKRKTLNISRLKNPGKGVNIKCDCGNVFKCRFETADDLFKSEAAMDVTQTLAVQQMVLSFQANDQNVIRISCPECRREKLVEYEKVKDIAQPANIRCACDHVFKCRFEPSQHSSSMALTKNLDTEGETRTIEADKDNLLRISCPSCGRRKTVEYAKVRKITQPVSIRCGCGCVFKCDFKPNEAETGHFWPNDEDLPEIEAQVVVENGKPPIPGVRTSLEEEKVFYADKNKTVTVVCPKCTFNKTFEVKAISRLPQPIPIDCPCGFSFNCRFEFRRTVRKNVSLVGEYVNLQTEFRGQMVVRDISLGGVGFSTTFSHSLKPGQLVEVNFKLNDVIGTEIKRKVKVRVIRDRFIGAEFLDKQVRDKEIGYYLMP